MIYCDADEVISPFVKPVCDVLRNTYGFRVWPHMVNTFNWEEINKISDTGITKEFWDEFLITYPYDNGPFPGAVEFTFELARFDEICYITARPESARANTEKLISQLAPGKLIMVNRSNDKFQYFDSDSVVIDDHPDTAVRASLICQRVYMPLRIHNKHINDSTVISVINYDEIVDLERYYRSR